MASGFWQAGHRPTLFAAFLYFDVSFMVWVILGPLGVQIATDLGLSPAQKGLMVATPVLSGIRVCRREAADIDRHLSVTVWLANKPTGRVGGNAP